MSKLTDPFTQLVAANVIIASLVVTLVLGGPAIPVIFGAVAAGGLLFACRPIFERFIGVLGAAEGSTRSETPAAKRTAQPANARAARRSIARHHR